MLDLEIPCQQHDLNPFTKPLTPHTAQYRKLLTSREKLPVYRNMDDFFTVVSTTNIVVIVGETGSGKTTQIPQFVAYSDLAYSNGKMIACTQPRRVAATSVAKRVAEEMDGAGICLAMSQLVLKTLVVHERTLATDILMGLLKALAKRRADLKIIIMSATLDAVKFQKYFSLRSDTNAPLFKVPGHMHPVEIFYTLDPSRTTLKRQSEPSFLCGPNRLYTTLFVTTTHATTAHLRPRPAARRPGYPSGRKVVVSTNIAETSLTIDGIVYVVDPGFSKQKVYNPRVRVESLLVSPISKSSAQQRAGRAGRTRPGKCFRLYTEKDFMSQLEERTYPEILRSNLSNTVLELVKLGIKDLVRFDYVDAPAPETLMRALELLNFLKALDDDGNLTPLGSMMAEFPLDPQVFFSASMFYLSSADLCQLAELLIVSPEFKCSNEILTITAMLSEARLTLQSSLHRPDGDHLTLLNVYNQYMQNKFDKNWTWSNYVSGRALAQVENVRAQLHDEKKLYQSIRKALVCGFFMQVAHREGEKGSYLTVKDNQIVALHPSCGLDTQPEWVLFNEFVLTMRPYIRTVSEVRPEWLLEFAPSYFDLSTLPDGETKRALQKVMNKKLGKSVTAAEKRPITKAKKKVQQKNRLKSNKRIKDAPYTLLPTVLTCVCTYLGKCDYDILANIYLTITCRRQVTCLMPFRLRNLSCLLFTCSALCPVHTLEPSTL
ncbi:DEAH-box ATP-dependent RNA helicase [Salix suchowensis]|nr:DEAH-box ATP-dependent RNA helicase [Salix suchowensis]